MTLHLFAQKTPGVSHIVPQLQEVFVKERCVRSFKLNDHDASETFVAQEENQVRTKIFSRDCAGLSRTRVSLMLKLRIPDLELSFQLAKQYALRLVGREELEVGSVDQPRAGLEELVQFPFVVALPEVRLSNNPTPTPAAKSASATNPKRTSFR